MNMMYEQYEALIDAEFPDDMDSICIQVLLVETIGRAIAQLHGENYDAIDDIGEGNLFEAEGVAALAALVKLGYIRRSDFVYDDDANPPVRRSV